MSDENIVVNVVLFFDLLLLVLLIASADVLFLCFVFLKGNVCGGGGGDGIYLADNLF
jgi:hypothetical protein